MEVLYTVTKVLVSLIQVHTPSSFQKGILKSAGLGEKKVFVSIDLSAVELQELLLMKFPKLKAGGGYEYMRSVAQTKLLEILF